MIEIAISLAIIAFALIAIIGVLPIGLRVQRDNREETIINQDAIYLMDAIRSGARGLDDLTNYVEVITIKSGSFLTTYLSPYSPPSFGFGPSPFLKLNNGSNIVGLLSTPQYYQGGTNHVTAYMRAISGNASEKPPQTDANIRDLAFAYRLTAEVTPYVYVSSDTSLQTSNLQKNLSEIRLTFRWPLFPNGTIGNGKLTFRTLASGNVQTLVGSPNLFFVQPSTFNPAP
jgi:type II secretory pathway pseudopilin PulG